MFANQAFTFLETHSILDACKTPASAYDAHPLGLLNSALSLKYSIATLISANHCSSLCFPANESSHNRRSSQLNSLNSSTVQSSAYLKYLRPRSSYSYRQNPLGSVKRSGLL